MVGKRRFGISGRIILGVTLLALVAAVIIIPPYLEPCGSKLTTLYAHGGYRFFENEQILTILHDKYCIEMTGEYRLGTFAMSDEFHDGVDCVFPASQAGLDYFQAQHPGIIQHSATNYQSPIVIYTWDTYIPDFVAAGLVTTEEKTAADNTQYTVHYLEMASLIEAIDAETTWRDLGMDIPGLVTVVSADPLASSGGMMWLAIMGTYRVPGNENGDRVIKLSDLTDNPEIMSALLDYYVEQGQQEVATNQLFNKFIRSGTAMPMVVSYENTYIGWYSQLPDAYKSQAQTIVGLYPADQTFLTQHTLASTSTACDPLVDIFVEDEQIAQIAWEHDGLRNGEGGIGARPEGASWVSDVVFGLPEPRNDVIDAIREAICTLDPLSCPSDD
jgi:hypothetical protein